MTWNERKFVNDVLAQNVKDVLAQNVNDVMLDRACVPYGFFQKSLCNLAGLPAVRPLRTRAYPAVACCGRTGRHGSAGLGDAPTVPQWILGFPPYRADVCHLKTRRAVSDFFALSPYATVSSGSFTTGAS